MELGGLTGVAVTELFLLQDGGGQSEAVALSVAVSELPGQPVGLNIHVVFSIYEASKV